VMAVEGTDLQTFLGIQFMKKVLITNYFAIGSPEHEVMAAIARREAAVGADVRYYSCDGALLACETDPWGNKILCINCRKRVDWASNTIGIKQTIIPIRVSKDYSVDLSRLQSLKNYHYRGINIGVGCASTYITVTRDQDLNINALTASLISKQLVSAQMIVDAFSEIVERERPDVVYLFNGRGFINRAIVGVCNKYSVLFVTVEVSANHERVLEYPASLPHSIEANTRKMRDLWMAADADEKLKTSISFYERKRLGYITNDRSYVASQKKGLLPDFKYGKKIIAIFNSSDDEIKSIGSEWSFSESFNQYDIVAELLSKTSEQDLFFIVRMHPNLEKVRAPWVKKWNRIKNFSNCYFIDADSPISSYEVLDAADKVLVFGSTMGAEAVAAGKVVILYGNSFYERLDICYHVKSTAHLINLCTQSLKPKSPEPALMYAYFLMRSGSELDGYTGCKRKQDYRLLGYRAPIRKRGGWFSGVGWIVFVMNRLGNLIIEWRIQKSLTMVTPQK